MGHVHLGVLPSSRKWDEVVRLLADRAPPDDVIAAAAVAAERELRQAAEDLVFVEAVRLIAALPQAAAAADFEAALVDIGLRVQDPIGLLELILALGERLDDVGRTAGRGTDFGELVRRALLGTVAHQIGDALPDLFESAHEELQAAVRLLDHPRAFSGFARAFFTTLLQQALASWLDRALSAQVGPQRRFAHVGERSAFDDALMEYCFDSTRILQEFAAGWYGTSLQGGGGFESEQAAAFGATAFKKMLEELQRKQDADA